MKRKKIMIICFTLFVVISCTIFIKIKNFSKVDREVTVSQIDKIQLGMNSDDVINICGNPYYSKNAEQLRKEISEGIAIKNKFEEIFPEEVIDDENSFDDLVNSVKESDQVEIMRYFISKNEEQELFLVFDNDILVVKKIIQ